MKYLTLKTETYPRFNLLLKKNILKNILLVNDWPLSIDTFTLTTHFYLIICICIFLYFFFFLRYFSKNVTKNQEKTKIEAKTLFV